MGDCGPEFINPVCRLWIDGKKTGWSPQNLEVVMKKEEIRPYQLAQLEILKSVDQICKENGFRYYLVWGTLLGAIREGGFIPWDADIDIAMMRDDYDRFCNYMIDRNDDRIVLSSFRNDRHHVSPHALVRLKGTHIVEREGYSSRFSPRYDGVYMDIFPIDGIPANREQQQKQIRKLARIQRIIEIKRARTYGSRTSFLKKSVKRFVSYLLTPISIHSLQEKADRISRMFSEEDSDFVASLAEPRCYPNQTYPRSVFGCGSICQFEGIDFPAPARPEEFLRISYGDYMKRPPEEERYRELAHIDHIDYGTYGDRFQ